MGNLSEKESNIKMKIIRPNNIEIGQLTNIQEISTIKAISDLIQIDEKYIQYIKTENFPNIEDCKLIKGETHPLIEAIHMAYVHHLPLILTPDVIWYCISSATATHINLNSEELRNKFVDHKGKKKIEIRRNDFVFGCKTNPWHEVIDEFTQKINAMTKNGIADKLVANFSTTTKESRVVSEIVLMDAMQKYFEYELDSECGIPEIRITGEKEDWMNLISKANQIAELIPNFSFWIESFNEILQHFLDVYDDKIDNNFWDNIYKIHAGSGNPYISGWIVGLFPYVRNNKKNTWKDPFQNYYLTTSDFSNPMNKVPFKWNYHDNVVNMLFVGGLIGVLAQKDNSLLPLFAYSIIEDKAKLN